MEKQIATKRIFGTDRYGREVLVAAPGQPIPKGFKPNAEKAPEPKAKPASRGSRKGAKPKAE